MDAIKLVASDAFMSCRTSVESFRKLIELARTGMGLKPVLFKDYANDPQQRNIVLVRHDVDHSLDNAMMLGAIEADMGVKATYFMLHPGDYDAQENYYGSIIKGRIVHKPDFFSRCRELVAMGHEVAIHNDFFQLSFLTKRPIIDLVREEMAAFQEAGIPVAGTASHGSTFVREIEATNYEIFTECVSGGRESGRKVKKGRWTGKTHGFSMKDVGLAYEAYFLPRNMDVSDTGSALSIHSKAAKHVNFNVTAPEHYDTIQAAAAGIDDIRLVMLIHPCWWAARP